MTQHAHENISRLKICLQNQILGLEYRITKYAVLPCHVVGLLQVKEDRHDMFAKAFQSE